MARPKGSRNKNATPLAPASLLSPKERITFLANVIIDRIIEDQASAQRLLKRLKDS